MIKTEQINLWIVTFYFRFSISKIKKRGAAQQKKDILLHVSHKHINFENSNYNIMIYIKTAPSVAKKHLKKKKKEKKKKKKNMKPWTMWCYGLA